MSKLTLIDLESVRTRLTADISQTDMRIRLVEKILAALVSQDGKPFTKRLLAPIKQALPDYQVHYENSYGVIYIRVWGQDVPYGQLLSLHIGYADSNRPECPKHYSDAASRAMYAVPYFNDAAQNGERRKALESLHAKVMVLNQRIAAFNETYESIGALQYYI